MRERVLGVAAGWQPSACVLSDSAYGSVAWAVFVTMSEYWELPAGGNASELLVCHWGRQVGTTTPSAVVPDGCVDIVWIDGRLMFAGPDTVPVVASPMRGGAVAGVRMRTWIATPLLRVSLGELVNARVPLEQIDAPNVLELEGRLEGLSSRSASAVIGEYVLGLSDRAINVDRLALATGSAILASGGSVRIDDLARAAGYSERQLHRRFTASVGYGPKTYARVVRFQCAKRLLRHGRTMAEVARRCGYADPSHLTRDFVYLGGSTPSEMKSEMFKAAAVGSAL